MSDEPKKAPIPDGVIALLVGKDGHVWATAADFDLSGYGGFKLHESQRIRARQAMRREFVRRTCNPDVAGALDNYTVEKIVEEVCRRLGHAEVFMLVGHPDVEVHWRDFINRDGR